MMNISTGSTGSHGFRVTGASAANGGGGGPPFVSPGLTPSPSHWTPPPGHSTFRPPPPFTLAEGGGGGGGMMLPIMGADGGVGGPPPPRRATRPADPAKYKTEMCRNWEQLGSCTYRQCTFAHGAEELRKPLGPAPQPVAPPSISAVERIMDAVATEIRGERDAQFQQHESNRALEQALRRMQQERAEEAQQLEHLHAHIAALQEAIADRDARIRAVESDDVQHLLATLRAK